ncbi:helix-turn-helix domain-containing protein [Facklamia sp. P12934]|uniref:helix-turn-helix domain-containing protein n=1 Tax=unclassified Facklamia TaxID=2622293 RepID=UPI003D17A66D
MQLGDKIKELRRKKEYSQEELAEKINVSRSAVAKWESNNGIPDITNLKKLSELFAMSVDTLIDYTNELEDISLDQNKPELDSSYIGGFYDIDLVGWNDGVFNAYILNEDENFIFYLLKDKTLKHTV